MFTRLILIAENRVFMTNLTNDPEYFKVSHQASLGILCVCGWKKTLCVVGKKDKLVARTVDRPCASPDSYRGRAGRAAT